MYIPPPNLPFHLHVSVSITTIPVHHHLFPGPGRELSKNETVAFSSDLPTRMTSFGLRIKTNSWVRSQRPPAQCLPHACPGCPWLLAVLGFSQVLSLAAAHPSPPSGSLCLEHCSIPSSGQRLLILQIPGQLSLPREVLSESPIHTSHHLHSILYLSLLQSLTKKELHI